MQREDRIRLTHMLEAAENAVQFISGRSESDLETDTMLFFALVHAIQIVGEAATKVSEATRRETSTIPWMQVIGTRNRVVHAYADVSYSVVWSTATEDLPPLIRELRAILT